jgi:hypothetical protein
MQSVDLKYKGKQTFTGNGLGVIEEASRVLSAGASKKRGKSTANARMSDSDSTSLVQAARLH